MASKGKVRINTMDLDTYITKISEGVLAITGLSLDDLPDMTDLAALWQSGMPVGQAVTEVLIDQEYPGPENPDWEDPHA